MIEQDYPLDGNIQVLYHMPCFDGFGAALAAYSIFGDRAKYIPVNYGQEPPTLPDDACIFILDFAFERKILLEWEKRCQFITVVDHHDTNLHKLEGLTFAHFDMAKSGAVLAWEYFNKCEAPLFFQYLQDRDLWKFELPDSKEVAAGLKAHPFDFDTWAELTEQVPKLIEMGKIILPYQERMTQEACRNARMVQFAGYDCPVANTTTYLSEVGMKLLDLYDSKISMFWFVDGKGLFRYSLRSHPGGPEVQKIAERYGGGGHPTSAGFVTHHDIFGIDHGHSLDSRKFDHS
jgi:uncharacterized protein